MEKDTALDIEKFKFFTPFQSFSESEINYILEHSKIADYKKKSIIFPIQSTAKSILFLLEGNIQLKASDGGIRQLSANTEPARNPLAQLRPSQYEISAIAATRILFVEPEVITQASHQNTEDDAYSINETSVDEHSEDDQIVYDLIMELQSDNIILPSLPDVAIKIRQVLEDENSGAKEIAMIILTDPAITAKMIKTANSAMYQRRSEVDNCQSAVVALGTKKTAQLVIAFTMRELFSSSNKLLDQRMKELWEHSIEVAALCFVLAKHTPGIAPEEALLSGLIHDIGVILILDKAKDYPSIANNKEQLETIINKMHAYLSGSILRKWGFKNELIEAGEEAEYWERDKMIKPDFCDLVNMAHLHLYIHAPKKESVPRLDKVPAFNKLALGKLTPKLSLQVLQEAQDVVEQTKNLLQT